MLGITLRYPIAPFCAMLRAGIGVAFITGMKVTLPAIGVSGLPSFISITPVKIPAYILGMLITSAITFGVIWLFRKRIEQNATRRGEDL